MEGFVITHKVFNEKLDEINGSLLENLIIYTKFNEMGGPNSHGWIFDRPIFLKGGILEIDISLRWKPEEQKP